MMESFVETIATSGVFAVLFFLLLMIEIRDSRNREMRYQTIIEKLTDEFKIVEDVSDNVDMVLDVVKCIERGSKNEETK